MLIVKWDRKRAIILAIHASPDFHLIVYIILNMCAFNRQLFRQLHNQHKQHI